MSKSVNLLPNKVVGYVVDEKGRIVESDAEIQIREDRKAPAYHLRRITIGSISELQEIDGAKEKLKLLKENGLRAKKSPKESQEPQPRVFGNRHFINIALWTVGLLSRFGLENIFSWIERFFDRDTVNQQSNKKLVKDVVDNVAVSDEVVSGVSVVRSTAYLKVSEEKDNNKTLGVVSGLKSVSPLKMEDKVLSTGSLANY